MSWYQQGELAVKAAQEAGSRRDFPREHWIPKGEERESLIIDDNLFSFLQHSYKRPGDKTDRHITCMAKVNPANPVCCNRLTPDSAAHVGYYTLMDLHRTERNGKTYCFELRFGRLVGANAMAYFMRKKAEGPLANRKVLMSRLDPSSKSYGEWTLREYASDPAAVFSRANYKGRALSAMFDDAERNPASMEALKRLFSVQTEDGRLVRKVPAFNYSTLFAPLNADEAVRELAGTLETGGPSSRKQTVANPDADDSDDIPF